MTSVFCFICSPSLGILDNWLPVLWKLRQAEPRARLLCVLPKPRSVDEIDLSSVLTVLAGRVFDQVAFRSHAGNWMTAATLPEAVALNRLGRVEAMAHAVAHRLEKAAGASRAAGALRTGLRRLERRAGPRTGALADPGAILAPVRAVLYDVSEEAKPYNADLMKHLDGVPRFSIAHGIDVKARDHEPRVPQHLGDHLDVTAYLFSGLEAARYREVFGLAERSLKVMGIPRHEPEWMATIVGESREAAAELGDGFVFVVSKPLNKRYLFPERKRAALEDVRRLASELGVRVVIKRHPKEHADGVCEAVFGREHYGDRWVYSNLHPFVLGAKCALAVSFASFVVLDMNALRTPVIERLDLRGIPLYDNPGALRDEDGEPVFSFRFWGVALGASDYARLKHHAGEIARDRAGIVDRLAERYRALFPVVPDVCATIARDISSRSLTRAEAAI